jgi:cytoskeletal protein RodZ
LDELGSLLREAREAKGLTLAEVQDEIRINKKYLEALENGQYETLPTQVHVKGYLRNYARFLNLDPTPLIDRYELNKESRPQITVDQGLKDDSALDSIEPIPDQVFFDPVNVELSGGGRSSSGSTQRLVIIVALLITLALVANRFLPMLTGNGDDNAVLTSSIQDVVSNIANEPTPISTPTNDTSIIPGAGDPITSTSRNDAVEIPTLTPTRPTLPVTLESIQLRLDVTERTWMRVTIDGEVVFEGLARNGDEPYFWDAQEEAQLLTGNAIAIFVTINDVELGRLGGRGEVVEETWTATGTS